MGEIFQSFVYTMLGQSGQFLLDKYYQYETVILILISFYSLLLIYARCILLFYYPYKMKKILHQERLSNIKHIREIWLQEKLTFPFFIVVPSRNELWIRRASKSPIEHGVSFFRERKTHKTDYEQLDYFYEKFLKNN